MASWKKVIVSGSNANLTALSVDNLTSGQVVIGGGTGNLSTTAINGTGTIVATTGASGLSHSGSFSGSFQGTISGGNAFIQDGNSFGTTAVLGTNDTQNLQFETNGSARMTISSSGNIGIGNTNPNVALDVTGEIAIRGAEDADDARMYFRAADNSNRFTIETDIDINNTLDKLGFRSTFVDNILVLGGDGNVAIGSTGSYKPYSHNGDLTTIPKLDVFGSGSIPLTIRTTNLNSDHVLFTSMDTNTKWWIALSGNDFRIYNTASAENILLGVDGSSFDTGNKVGIGIALPSQKLDVSGSVNIIESASYKQDGSNVIYIAKGIDTFYANTIGGAAAGTPGLSRQTVYGHNAGALSSGSEQTTFGYYAGYNNAGNYQTAVGPNAGYTNKGNSQTAVGYGAGYFNSASAQTTVGESAGQWNAGIEQTAVGYLAGWRNSTSYQTAVGTYSGYLNSGSNQTAFGASAGYLNSASNQTVVGLQAGYRNSGTDQTAVGTYSGYLNSGSNQTAIGVQAGYRNSGSNQNVFGHQAGYGNSGSNQTAAGYQSGYLNSGSSQTTFGIQSGYANRGNNQTSIGAGAGNNNLGDSQTAVGYQSGFENTGSWQVAVGYQAGLGNSGSSQTTVGYRAGLYNTASAQTALGESAGQWNAGISQTAVGAGAGIFNSGSYQTAIGVIAGWGNLGNNQTAVGAWSGYLNSGSDNTNIGYDAGRYTTGTTANTISTQSVFLGSSTKAGGPARTNQIVIGYGAEGIGSNSVVLGNDSITTTALKGNVGIGTIIANAKLSIWGGTLGTSSGDYLASQTIQSLVSPTNGETVEFGSIRTSNGNDWTTSGFRIQERMDNAWQAFMQFNGDGNNNGISFGTGTSTGSRQSVPTRMTITSEGNVGIGTTAPTAKLDVSGSIMIASGLNNSSPRPALNVGTLQYGEIRSYNSISGSAYDDGFMRISAGGGTHIGGKSYIDISGYSNVDDMNNTIAIGTAGTERIRIDRSGSVGIGTSFPSASLHVNNIVSGLNSFLVEDSTNPDNTPFVIDANGNVGIGISTTSGAWVGTASLHIVTSGSNSDRGSSVALRLRESASNAQFNLSPFSSSAAGKSLALNDDTTGAALQVWTENGNVGIGKETANAKLDVSGNTIITGSLTVTSGITGSITASGVYGPYGANSVISSSYAATVAATTGTLTFGEGLTTGTFNGSSNVTLTVSGAAQLTDNAITKWNDTDNKFVVSSLTDNGTAVTGASSIQLTGASSSLTGSFTGSFKGDGSGLTGLASTLNVSASLNALSPFLTSGSVSLTSQGLTIQGTINEIEAVIVGQTVSIGLPNDVAILNQLTVGGDLIVNGTTTTVNTTDLLIEDKFILLASGSTASGDAGIIVDRGADANSNIAFGFDADTDRWGFQNGLTDSTNAMTIGTNGNSAFAGIVFTEAAHTATKPTTGEFVKEGAIYTNTDGTIWMYS